VRGAERHRQLRRVARQLARPRAVGVPGRELIEHALAQVAGVIAPPLNSTASTRGPPWRARNDAEVPRDRRVAGVGQPELLQAAAAALRRAPAATTGKKPSSSTALAARRAVTRSRSVPAISRAPRAATVIGTSSGGASPSSASFARRQAWTSPCHCSASSRLPPPAVSRCSTSLASVRSTLSPPSSR
jgi:hypothetical protein